MCENPLDDGDGEASDDVIVIGTTPPRTASVEPGAASEEERHRQGIMAFAARVNAEGKPSVSRASLPPARVPSAKARPGRATNRSLPSQSPRDSDQLPGRRGDRHPVPPHSLRISLDSVESGDSLCAPTVRSARPHPCSVNRNRERFPPARPHVPSVGKLRVRP